MNTKDIKAVYFVGAGGIGMSAIARYFLKKGEEPTPDPSLEGRESQSDIP